MDRPILSKQGSFNSTYPGLASDGHIMPYSPSYVSSMQQTPYPAYLSPRATPRATSRPANVFRFDASYPLFAGDWSVNNLIALASFNEQPSNSIMIVEAQHHQQLFKFTACAEVPVSMPQTKLAFEPFGTSKLMSSGEFLRLWQYQRSQLTEVATFVKRSKSQPHQIPAPLTSFDWNSSNPNVVIAASIDTTCTVWDLTHQSVTTQLIAHDKEVNDVAFLTGSQHKFVSAGADGSLRLFDLRALDSSTIIYESHTEVAGNVPMLRAAPSLVDQNTICAFGQEENHTVILDIRATRNPVTKLEGHQAPLNSVRWLPNASNLLATGSDDCQILLWDLSRGIVVGSHNEYQQVNNILASKDGNWLGSISGKSLQAVSTQML